MAITHPKVSRVLKQDPMATEVKETSTNIENLKILAGYCDVNSILATIGLRWKMSVLFCISNGVYQFSRLKKVFPTLSDQVLGKRIGELQEEGLIVKQEISDTCPYQFKYEITEKGKELLTIIMELNAWGKKWK